MSGNIVQPPSSSGSNEAIDLIGICEAVGWPKERVTQEYVTRYMLPSIEATFCDGEVMVPHPVEEDSLNREYFGETIYNEGAFGTRLRELFDGEDIAMRGKVDKLVRFSAAVFAKQVVTGHVQLPGLANVTIGHHPATPGGIWIDPRLRIAQPTLGFDEKEVSLPRYPEAVIDYGPGLQGRFRIEEQMGDMMSGQQPYTHVAVAKGPFINEFLMQYWANRYNNQGILRQILGSAYIGREDGIASASTEIVTSQQQRMGTTEIADLVLASGIHTAGHQEVTTGINNAYKLLKPEGVLLVRAPKDASKENAKSVPAKDMIDAALSAGFQRSRADFYDTVTGGDTTPNVHSVAAVFRK